MAVPRTARCGARRAAGKTARRCGFRVWVLSLALGGVLAGCGEETGNYFPLETGLTWGYRIAAESKGVGRTNYRSFVSNLAPEVVADVTATPRIVHDGRVYYDAEEPDGIRRVAARRPGEGPVPASPGEYVLKYPLEPGTTWRVRTSTQLLRRQVITSESVAIVPMVVELDLDYRVVAVDSVVSVPAGRFRGCVQVRGAGKVVYDTDTRQGVITIEVETTEWFAPGVGLVRLVRTERSHPENPFSGELVKELVVFEGGSWLG